MHVGSGKGGPNGLPKCAREVQDGHNCYSYCTRCSQPEPALLALESTFQPTFLLPVASLPVICFPKTLPPAPAGARLLSGNQTLVRPGTARQQEASTQAGKQLGYTRRSAHEMNMSCSGSGVHQRPRPPTQVAPAPLQHHASEYCLAGRVQQAMPVVKVYVPQTLFPHPKCHPLLTLVPSVHSKATASGKNHVRKGKYIKRTSALQLVSWKTTAGDQEERERERGQATWHYRKALHQHFEAG